MSERDPRDTIRASSLFDEAWYLEQYPDVKRAGVDAADHYLKYGWKEGRNPSVGFETTSYLRLNPDVAEAGQNPLVHFIEFGERQGRKAPPVQSLMDIERRRQQVRQFNDVLTDNFASILEPIESACTDDLYRSFHDLNDEIWRTLLLKIATAYPRILAVLPDWPDEDLQRKWVGNAGIVLHEQSSGFIRNLKAAYAKFGAKPLAASTVLDFGMGWGRLIRYLAKDVPAENLLGCDPEPKMISLCQELKVPGKFRKSDYRPKSLPFDEKIDLIYAFSIFTHLSERTHLECLRCLHATLNSGGIAVITIRPRTFAPHMGRSSDEYGSAYLFKPFDRPAIDGEVTYGDALIPDEYVRTVWSDMFEVLDQWWLVNDAMQVAYVLRKR